MAKILKSKNPEETYKIAREVAKAACTGDIFALHGDLGSGKTTFVQGFLAALGVKNIVTSPTFVIMKKYSVPNSETTEAFHIDAYRLNGSDDLEAIGFLEIITKTNAIIMIEWPEKISSFLKNYTGRIKTISFKYIGENEREIVL